MQWIYFVVMIFVGVAAASLGLMAGISFNPESTVKFVIIWGNAEAWTLWGTWAGAAGTILAVALALYYSRHDDKEKLTLISEVHSLQDAMSQVKPQMTMRVVCTGRLPTTIIAIGFGVRSDLATFYPVARYTTSYESRKHLSRGEIFEATLDVQSIFAIGRDFWPHVGVHAEKLSFVVITGLKTYREKLSPEAIAVLALSLKES
jgi:hypothetical protein